MSKHITTTTVISNLSMADNYHLIEVQIPKEIDLSIIRSGQFVQVQSPASSGVLLCRPISIHDVDVDRGVMTLLVCRVGAGTDAICSSQPGHTLSIIWPLGNGFSIPTDPKSRVLLMGGGVGVAPLLYLGKQLKKEGVEPHFLLAARSSRLLLRVEEYSEVGTVDIATDDGSLGHKGLITQHPVFAQDYDTVYCCGPMPMMKAIARDCHSRNIPCEVSLENTMACGIGACLCCVEKTVKGNRCVCTDGPVFNINELTWF